MRGGLCCCLCWSGECHGGGESPQSPVTPISGKSLESKQWSRDCHRSPARQVSPGHRTSTSSRHAINTAPGPAASSSPQPDSGLFSVLISHASIASPCPHWRLFPQLTAHAHKKSVKRKFNFNFRQGITNREYPVGWAGAQLLVTPIKLSLVYEVNKMGREW